MLNFRKKIIVHFSKIGAENFSVVAEFFFTSFRSETSPDENVPAPSILPQKIGSTPDEKILYTFEQIYTTSPYLQISMNTFKET